MISVDDALLLLGLLVVPAAAVVGSSLALGWLERRQALPMRPADFDRPVAAEGTAASSTRRAALLWALPFAALSAALVLAPVVCAVWSVVADAPAVGYLVTVGFGIGALMVGRLADGGDDLRGPRKATPWSRTPGVLLSSAVGFIIAVVGFLGTGLAGFLGFENTKRAGILASLVIAVVLGGLAVAVTRRRG